MVSTTSGPARELFGGALQTTLPSTVIDVRQVQAGQQQQLRDTQNLMFEVQCSDLRQVPDTQEVFVFPDSDVSIVFEILQIVDEGEAATDLRKAVEFHFKSIAHDNSALSTTVDAVSSPLPLPSSVESSTKGPHSHVTLEGVQIASKFNLPESESDLVKIFLCLVRVDLGEPSAADSSLKRGADITVCVNVPLGKARDIDSQAGGLPDEIKQLELEAKDWFERAVKAFKICDYDLFA